MNQQQQIISAAVEKPESLPTPVEQQVARQLRKTQTDAAHLGEEIIAARTRMLQLESLQQQKVGEQNALITVLLDAHEQRQINESNAVAKKQTEEHASF